MSMNFKVIWHIDGDLGMYKMIVPNIEQVLISVFSDAYNKFCEMSNGGITDKLNKEYDEKYDKASDDTERYNQFMAEGYTKYIVNELNKDSVLLEYFIDPEEVVFKGRLKKDHNVQIYLH